MDNKKFDLNTGWFIATDEDNVGKSQGWENAVRDTAVTAHVPSIIQQFFPEYHGVAYYWCSFVPDINVGEGECAIIRFGGVDYKAEVWLNSVYLGSYEGGETPFSFDVSDVLKFGEENLLAVRVINPVAKEIDGLNLINTPHRNKVLNKRAGSNLNHGGIWYGVTLSVLPSVYISEKFIHADLKSGTIKIMLDTRSKAPDSVWAKLSVTVYENNSFTDKIVSKTVDTEVASGDGKLVTDITLSEFIPWDVDNPHLYRVELSLKSEYGEHVISQKTGFREFVVKDGFFYLNGKKIFIKSAHSGNAFPAGLMFPTTPELLNRDFTYAKAAGFNMIRAIAGLFRPEQLDFADEIGLLIWEECFASWCMGYSMWEKWSNDEEYQRVNEKHPEMPIGDEKLMLARYVDATEKMIIRDRNHTSVVAFGLLNETKNNSVFRTACEFLPRARELDPTRLIILNSGRFDFDVSIGSASNPYSTVWENVWGNDGRPDLFNEKDPYVSVGDNHFYCRAPMTARCTNLYRTIGKDYPLPVFISETGIGSQFHVSEEYKGFIERGERLDLPDASWLEYQTRAFEKDFYAYGLDKLFPFPDALLKESQRVNADERKRVFDCIRSNPYFCGYSLTGLLDHGMCGEGLWSYWRKWKPLMFDAVSDGWAPLRFSLFVTPELYRGDEIELEAVLANDNVLRSGKYVADFGIEDDEGTYLIFSEEFDVDENVFVNAIMKRKIKLDLPEGSYRFTANLRRGVPAATATAFRVTDKAEFKKPTEKVYAIGLSDAAKEFVRENVTELCDFDDTVSSATVIAGYTDLADTKRLLDAASRGATVFFLDANTFENFENLDAMKSIFTNIRMTKRNDWLYHKEYVLADRAIFSGIKTKLAGLTCFGVTFPHRAFEMDNAPELALCPGFLTGYYDVEMSYASLHAMPGAKYGKGRVILSSFELLNNLTYPVAGKILSNIISYK